MCLLGCGSRSVLLIGDVLHPIDNLAVAPFLDSNMSHRRSRRGAVPVLFAGRDPHHIARADFVDGTAPALNASAARRDDKGLAQRVRMPCRPRAGLESYAGPLNECRFWGLN